MKNNTFFLVYKLSIKYKCSSCMIHNRENFRNTYLNIFFQALFINMARILEATCNDLLVMQSTIKFPWMNVGVNANRSPMMNAKKPSKRVHRPFFSFLSNSNLISIFKTNMSYQRKYKINIVDSKIKMVKMLKSRNRVKFEV